MDGHLRLILLVVAGIIVTFILLESWYRRRQSRQAQGSSPDRVPVSINADQVLGLDSREPIVNPRMANLDGTLTETHYIKPNSMARSNAAYANKTYPGNANTNPKSDTANPSAILNDLLVISVVAGPGTQFGSYDLLQAISTTGMQFGEMNIFHYKIGNETLFSLSSATEPGDFNLDRMGDFACDGLTLFANLRDVSNPEQVFELMLSSAEQLAEDLGGELRAGTRRPWNDQVCEAYRHKVMQYQLEKSV